MNLVVHPDGTVELDERPAADIPAFDRSPVSINLFHDKSYVGRALCQMQGPTNRLATRLVAHIAAGAHIRFEGPVVISDLTPEQAVELLEMAK
jgi:hypothetical protein